MFHLGKMTPVAETTKLTGHPLPWRAMGIVARVMRLSNTSVIYNTYTEGMKHEMKRAQQHKCIYTVMGFGGFDLETYFARVLTRAQALCSMPLFSFSRSFSVCILHSLASFLRIDFLLLLNCLCSECVVQLMDFVWFVCCFCVLKPR